MMKNFNRVLHKARCLAMALPVVATLSVQNGFAQDADSGAGHTLMYGPKVGLTSSGFYEGFFGGRQHTGSVTGVAVGGFAVYDLLDFVSASANLCTCSKAVPG